MCRGDLGEHQSVTQCGPSPTSRQQAHQAHQAPNTHRTTRLRNSCQGSTFVGLVG
jgi:hypothetical protein